MSMISAANAAMPAALRVRYLGSLRCTVARSSSVAVAKAKTPVPVSCQEMGNGLKGMSTSIRSGR